MNDDLIEEQLYFRHKTDFTMFKETCGLNTMRIKCYISWELPDIRHQLEQHEQYDVQYLQLLGDLQCHFQCARFCCEKNNMQ